MAAITKARTLRTTGTRWFSEMEFGILLGDNSSPGNVRNMKSGALLPITPFGAAASRVYDADGFGEFMTMPDGSAFEVPFATNRGVDYWFVAMFKRSATSPTGEKAYFNVREANNNQSLGLNGIGGRDADVGVTAGSGRLEYNGVQAAFNAETVSYVAFKGRGTFNGDPMQGLLFRRGAPVANFTGDGGASFWGDSSKILVGEMMGKAYFIAYGKGAPTDAEMQALVDDFENQLFTPAGAAPTITILSATRNVDQITVTGECSSEGQNTSAQLSLSGASPATTVGPVSPTLAPKSGTQFVSTFSHTFRDLANNTYTANASITDSFGGPGTASANAGTIDVVEVSGEETLPTEQMAAGSLGVLVVTPFEVNARVVTRLTGALPQVVVGAPQAAPIMAFPLILTGALPGLTVTPFEVELTGVPGFPDQPLAYGRIFTLLYGMSQTETWAPKSPDEVFPVLFNFETALAGAGIGSAVVTISVLNGNDTNPQAMKLGNGYVSGGTVRQWLRGGKEGCTYAIKCTVNMSDLRRLVATARLPVKSVF